MENLNFNPVKELEIRGYNIKTDVVPIFGDDRGYFTAINFEEGIKRAYLIKNHRAGVVRAFHGHKKETKTLHCIKGAFKVICISMETGGWKSFTITEKGQNILKIPSMIYNGFVSLTHDSELLILSDSTFEESKNDDFRLPYDTLGKEVWEVEHR
ncbi:MAG: WxcM-like domain-containing protein [Nanoarchaeota archaeon]|nr:WxcM-like domain-containing protein [Nanoarchaeota archaeon]